MPRLAPLLPLLGRLALPLGLFAATPACAQTYTGSLDPDDPTLNQGEHYDTYTVDVEAGEWLEVDLTSSDFDPYLVAIAPSGDDEQNDDFEGSRERSHLRFRASESGTYRVLATSYAAGERGRYRLEIAAEGGRGQALPAGLRGDDEAGVRYERGELEEGDETLNSGEYRDAYTFEGRAGQNVVLDLRAQAFDPYLILDFPGDDQLDNDDHEGDVRRSLISTTLPEDGTYRVLVTSYRVGETGAYDLQMRGTVGGGAGGPGYTPGSGRRVERGQLAAGDPTLGEGEFYDTYTFEGVPGRRVRLDLTSSAFDTYLVLQPPRGENVQNDDFEGDVRHSRIEMDLTEPGTYTVYATSYAGRETGAYELVLDLGGTALQPGPRDGDRPDPGAAMPVSRDAGRLTLNQAAEGTLDRGDQLLSSGEFVDLHTFDGEAGEPIRIELASPEFDAYLMVTTPDGEQIDNDDAEAGDPDAMIEFVMAAAGRYQVRVTSYAAGETGRYSLRITQAGAMAGDAPAAPNVVGLFVGISDYPGEVNDLPYTASDAARVRDALVQGVGMPASDAIVLTDGEATRERFRQALASLAARSDERTTLVLFYSGHGNQTPRAGGADAADPDGRDETISLYDGDVLDDELARMLDAFRGGRQIVVLDACYSGGFSKDVISRPGRMGLFSSEEDILSAVASKFEAGGYLSYFFADALAERRADEDRNGSVTALELSTYLRERYEGDVRDEGRTVVRGRETRLDQQELVVDRGSVGPFDTLFLLR
jgi:hypothetical protein